MIILAHHHMAKQLYCWLICLDVYLVQWCHLLDCQWLWHRHIWLTYQSLIWASWELALGGAPWFLVWWLCVICTFGGPAWLLHLSGAIAGIFYMPSCKQLNDLFSLDVRLVLSQSHLMRSESSMLEILLVPKQEWRKNECLAWAGWWLVANKWLITNKGLTNTSC